MNVTLDLPEVFVREMHLDQPEAQRRALIALAVEGYRAGELSRGQISELLDLSFWDTAALLNEHGCGLGNGMSVEDYERESERARAMFKR